FNKRSNWKGACVMYLALDFPNFRETKIFLENNNLQGVPVKVGMELFYKEGTKILEYLKNNNHSIFLDLKLFDIPTTVKNAMRNLAYFEVDFVNVHALGGTEMIKQAKEGLQTNSTYDTKLLAVTVLTSMYNQVIRFVKRLEDIVASGIVCYVHEVDLIKETTQPNFITMTPGIRLLEDQTNDQKRVATPKFAKQNGSDYIVIGRSVTQAKNPK